MFLFGKTADFVKDPYDRLALDLKRENFYFSVLGYSSSDRILARAAWGLGVFFHQLRTCVKNTCAFLKTRMNIFSLIQDTHLVTGANR